MLEIPCLTIHTEAIARTESCRIDHANGLAANAVMVVLHANTFEKFTTWRKDQDSALLVKTLAVIDHELGE